VIPSAVLQDASNASAAFEAADLAMRREWPAPSVETIRRWNDTRRAAESASQVVVSASR